MSNKTIYIVDARRLPMGKFGGWYRGLKSWQLGAGLLRRLGALPGVDLSAVAAVFVGHCRQAGNGPNPARTAALLAGVPQESFATTVNTACLSGLDALRAGVDFLSSGRGEAVICGGMESMSSMPHLVEGLRFKRQKHGDLSIRDSWSDALDPLVAKRAGECAEETAERLDISRDSMDELAVGSHRRAREAWRQTLGVEVSPAVDQPGEGPSSGVEKTKGEKKGEEKKNQSDALTGALGRGPLAREVVNGSMDVLLPGGQGKPQTRRLALPMRDETVRDEADLKGIAWLRPVFKDGGRLTAGNTCSHADGAAFFLLATEEYLRRFDVEPRGRLGRFFFYGGAPAEMTLAPGKMLASRDRDYDTFGVHESFASQVLANIREGSVPYEKMNLHGGGLALGHPTGVSGARVVLSVLSVLESQGGEAGLALLTSVGGLCEGVEVFR